MMDAAAFVEGRFEHESREVVARFYLPFLAEGGEYRCRWMILWPERKSAEPLPGSTAFRL